MTRIKVEIVYALPHSHALRRVELEANATIADAIAASGIGRDFPEIDPGKNRVGIYGRRLTAEAPLHEGDRVEIYRPLTADPKETRRRRAQHARRAKK
ncbi:MAG: RnfH family protein [Betaproteobacteria bacterium RIFCSPLOWO2_02_FULL_62_17]|nr:MAG: RnfH family protein [Betaproteobacteria bacterium RIFCSPLOWO2_02_FULL_62_17]